MPRARRANRSASFRAANRRTTPDSLTIRDATIIEAIGHGRTGHPHIVRALARLLGGVFVPLPVGPEDPDGIRGSVVTLTCELGDVARAIGDALSDDGEVDAREATDALLQLDELDAASAALRIKLQRIAATPKKGRAR